MSWGRLLLYLGYALGLTVLAAVIVTGLAIGDCSLKTVDCGEDRRLVAFGAWAIALLFLAVRFLRDPSKLRWKTGTACDPLCRAGPAAAPSALEPCD